MKEGIVYDVFVSHAGESKPFARQLVNRLGGNDGKSEHGLGLKAFLDQEALVPGDQADEVMMMCLEKALVGVILLDDFFLTKKYPVAELRAIMVLAESDHAAGKVVPVMYSTTYANVNALIERLSSTDKSESRGANAEDADMLAKLKRTTMIHSDTEYVDRFLETICFAVLRHLVDACERDTHHRPIQKTVYTLNVREAVKYVSAHTHYRHLTIADKDESREWLSELDVTYRKMQNGQSDSSLPQPANHIEHAYELADGLEAEFVQPALQKHLKTIQDKAKAYDDDAWPQVLWTMPDAESGPVWEAMKMLWPFWRKVQRLYSQKRLLQPGEDPDNPLGFFNKKWAGRGAEYRTNAEPVDIANWYVKNKHVDIVKDGKGVSGHYVDFKDGEQLEALSAKDNGRRPGRYILLQEEEKRVFGVAIVKSSLTKGYEVKALLGDRPWEDVVPRGALQAAPSQESGGGSRTVQMLRVVVDVGLFVAGVLVGRRLR